MLTLLNTGSAPPEALERGLAAAAASLAASGIDPALAWRHVDAMAHGAAFNREAVAAWYEAEQDAVLAAYGRWRLAPLDVALEWRPGESQ